MFRVRRRGRGGGRWGFCRSNRSRASNYFRVLGLFTISSSGAQRRQSATNLHFETWDSDPHGEVS